MPIFRGPICSIHWGMETTAITHAPSVWLAPMSGATDAPFRRQVVRFGGELVVSEMTASEQLIMSRPDVVRRACRHEGPGQWIVQLAGRDPAHMKAASARLARAGVDVIDINMGCPSRKVTGGLSGSALMREPELADRIIHATLEGAGSVPVSLKMRLGWDDSSFNAPEIAERAERAGIFRLTVHGRTRCQFYKGKADWEKIADTVSAVDIPVIANGDIGSAEDARMALGLSNADGVMVGRAAIGRPWLIAQMEADLAGQIFDIPTHAARFQSLQQQIGDAVSLYGERTGVRVCRKHISAALQDAFGESDQVMLRALQTETCTIDSQHSLIACLRSVFLDGPKRAVA